MAAPSLMFKHTLEAVKGWFHIAALDFSAKISANVTIDPVYGGRVVHLNSSGELEMGVSGTQMPIFLLQKDDDPDVSQDAVEGSVNISPSGKSSGLVATGGYEFESTEYNTSRTYAPNNLLSAGTSNSVAATGGVLTNENGSGTALTVPWAGGGTTRAIVGVVSRGEVTNGHKQDAVAFWPVYLPGTT